MGTYTFRQLTYPATPRSERRRQAGSYTVSASGSAGSSGGSSFTGYWTLVTTDGDGNPLDDGDMYISASYTAKSSGDVVAYATSDDDGDIELPVATAGTLGAVSVLAGGGILVDSDGNLYIDPDYAGSGGVDFTTDGSLTLSDGVLGVNFGVTEGTALDAGTFYGAATWWGRAMDPSASAVTGAMEGVASINGLVYPDASSGLLEIRGGEDGGAVSVLFSHVATATTTTTDDEGNETTVTETGTASLGRIGFDASGDLIVSTGEADDGVGDLLYISADGYASVGRSGAVGDARLWVEGHVKASGDVVAYATSDDDSDIALPIATATSLGAVMIGDNLVIDSDGVLSAVADGGAAESADTLTTARSINGTAFDGSADITTEYWGTARTIYISDSGGSHTGTGVSVDGSGNATLYLPSTITATLSGTATRATYLGSSTVGSGTNPIYLSSGAATASSSTVGSGTRPIYLSSGTLTVSSATVGSSTAPVYLNGGTLTKISSYEGNATTATTLATSRTIWGNSFNGSANIGGTLTPLSNGSYYVGTDSYRFNTGYFTTYIRVGAAGTAIGEGDTATRLGAGSLELDAATPYITFRHAKSTSASIQLITTASTTLNCSGNLTSGGYMRATNDVVAYATSGTDTDIELPTASSSAYGAVKIDNDTICINSSGQLYCTVSSSGSSSSSSGSGVTSVTTSGSGNAVTAGSISGTTLTLTKGTTFLTSIAASGTGNGFTAVSYSSGAATLTKGYFMNAITQSTSSTSVSSVVSKVAYSNGTLTVTTAPVATSSSSTTTEGAVSSMKYTTTTGSSSSTTTYSSGCVIKCGKISLASCTISANNVANGGSTISISSVLAVTASLYTSDAFSSYPGEYGLNLVIKYTGSAYQFQLVNTTSSAITTGSGTYIMWIAICSG